MLLKNKLFLLPALVMTMTACSFEVDDVYDKLAAARYKEAYEQTSKDLLAAANGWVMEYFPTSEKPGFVLLVKFETKDSVTFSAKNSFATGNVYKKAGSRYDLTSKSTPRLIFSTYNDIFHLFSDPSQTPTGYGMEGDLEFFIMQENENLIELKGCKRNTRILLKKCPENIAWEDYLDQINAMKSFLFSPGVPTLSLHVNDKVYLLSNGASSIFQITGEEISATVPKKIPYVVTLEGIRLHQALEVDGKKLQTFQLSEDENSLICSDEGVEATIVGPNQVEFFHDMLDNYSKKYKILNEDGSLSPLVRAVYDRIVREFTRRKITLEQIAYMYYERNSTQTHSVYIKPTTGVGAYLFFDKAQTAEGVNYTFRDDYDGNGRVMYTNYDGVADLMQLMSGSFKIELLSSHLNPFKIKLTNISNPDVWFTMILQ